MIASSEVFLDSEQSICKRKHLERRGNCDHKEPNEKGEHPNRTERVLEKSRNLKWIVLLVVTE